MRSELYTKEERNYLLGALISASDSVANVASVYGSYLKQFKPTALNQMRLNPVVPSERKGTVLQMDAQDLCKNQDYVTKDTLLYLDPPYNHRQYGANYFPLNAIADIYSDNYTVVGVSGLPAQGYKKSLWASRKKAKDALLDIVKNTPARRIAMSYNSEGILTHGKIISVFNENGWQIRRIEIPYKRFITKKHNLSQTTEYLFLATRE